MLHQMQLRPLLRVPHPAQVRDHGVGGSLEVPGENGQAVGLLGVGDDVVDPGPAVERAEDRNVEGGALADPGLGLCLVDEHLVGGVIQGSSAASDLLGEGLVVGGSPSARQRPAAAHALLQMIGDRLGQIAGGPGELPFRKPLVDPGEPCLPPLLVGGDDVGTGEVNEPHGPDEQ